MHLLKHPNTTANTFYKYILKMDIHSFITNTEFMPRLGMFYAIKELLRVSRNKELKQMGAALWAVNNFINGAGAGYLTILLTYPIQIPSSILFMRSAKWNTVESLSLVGYKKYLHLIRKGIDIHYRGFFLSSINTMLYRGILYGFFDTAKIFVKRDPIVQVLLGSMGAGMGSIVVYPLVIVIKNRILKKEIYRNNYESWRGIVKEEGWRGLYKGIKR